jgi:predicted nucleotidyltransferase
MSIRLANKFQKKIVEYFQKWPLIPGEKVFLFGSRANPEARGGDIDLLLECEDSLRLKEFQKQRTQMKSALMRLVDDQKVDLKISLISDKDPFTQSIRKKAVLLLEK